MTDDHGPPVRGPSHEPAADDAAPGAAESQQRVEGAGDPGGPGVVGGVDLDTGPVAEPARGPWWGIAIAVVAAGCLVAACFSHRWLANRHRGDLGYSPLSFQDCTGKDPDAEPACQTLSNFQIARNTQSLPFEEDRVSMAFPVAGLITFVALLVAAAGLVLAAALAAARRRPDLPVSPTTIALLGVMAGLISGCVFVATKPGTVGAVGVAWSFWLFGIGSVAGIAGAQLLAKQLRPADPDLLHDAMNPDQF